MFMWIIKALKGITATHKQGKFPFNSRGFALNEGETHEQGFTRVEGELAAAKEAGGKSFFNSLSSDVRSNPSIMKFEKTSNEDIAKSYINLQSKISAKGLTIPGKNASADEKASFWKELGRPDTADGYQLTLPQDLHKSITSDAGSQKAFKAKCHEIGLDSERTQLLHSWYMTELSNNLKQKDASDEKALNEGKNALNSKWGTTTEANTALAGKVVDKFGGEKAQALREKIGTDPDFVELFANIGEKLSEDALGPGGKSQFGGLTPAAAQAKIAEIRANKDHPFNNEGPLHKEAVTEMTTLYRIVEGV